ncbi:hypothetical protein Tco_0997139 [Tanacetum coccineum]
MGLRRYILRPFGFGMRNGEDGFKDVFVDIGIYSLLNGSHDADFKFPQGFEARSALISLCSFILVMFLLFVTRVRFTVYSLGIDLERAHSLSQKKPPLEGWKKRQLHTHLVELVWVYIFFSFLDRWRMLPWILSGEFSVHSA